MKLNNKHSWSVKRLLTLTMALVMALTMLSPMTAEAKTKTVSLKSMGFTTELSVVKKKATKINTGTYILSQKKDKGWGRGYLVFTAPKTKTYSFTLSSLKSDDGAFTNGYLGPRQIRKSYYSTSFPWVQMKVKNYPIGNLRIASKVQGSTPTSRKGTMKLKKGETVYLYCEFLGSFKKGKITSKLVIK